MTANKPFRILVEVWGGGREKRGEQVIAVIADSGGNRKTKTYPGGAKTSSDPEVTPGLNPSSPYSLGLTQGRGVATALNTVECPVESTRHATLKTLCAALKALMNKKYLPWRSR